MSGGDRRRAARVALKARVLARVRGHEDLSGGVLRDVSTTGAFVVSEATRPIGTSMSLVLVLTELERKLALDGLVVFERKRGDGPDRPPGMGIMFMDNPPAVTKALDLLIQNKLNTQPRVIQVPAPPLVSPDAVEPPLVESPLVHAPPVTRRPPEEFAPGTGGIPPLPDPES